MDSGEKFWNNVAARYAEKPISDLAAYHAKLDATRACLEAEDVVLDVGCGTGTLALELSRCVSEVHAIDLSGEMIKIGEHKAADADVRNVTFHNTTLGHVPFGGESFDAVCAFNILHLIDDRPAALSTIFDLLKPGGAFISTTACLGDSRVPFRLLLPIAKRLGKAPAVQVFGIRELEENLRDAGFVEITAKRVSSSKIAGFLVAAKPGVTPDPARPRASRRTART